MISHATEVVCPWCGAAHEFSTGLFQDELFKPTAGAVTICIKCAKTSVFTDELALRRPAAEEALAHASDPRILQAQIIMSGFDRERSAA